MTSSYLYGQLYSKVECKRIVTFALFKVAREKYLQSDQKDLSDSMNKMQSALMKPSSNKVFQRPFYIPHNPFITFMFMFLGGQNNKYIDESSP